MNHPDNCPYFLDFYNSPPASNNLLDIFAKKQPLHVEIGCGHGHFLMTRAKTRLSENFMGLDKSLKRVNKAIAKAEKQKLPNIRFAFADAWKFFEHYKGNAVIDRLYFNFPDPWFKRKHFKRRLISEECINVSTQMLGSGGRLVLVSDFKENAVNIEKYLKALPWMAPCSPEERDADFTNYPESLYHSKWREENRDIYFILYKRL